MKENIFPLETVRSSFLVPKDLVVINIIVPREKDLTKCLRGGGMRKDIERSFYGQLGHIRKARNDHRAGRGTIIASIFTRSIFIYKTRPRD